MSHDQYFDEYAEDYDQALAEGISISGEDKDYFARSRVSWLANTCLRGELPSSVLDFGCGTGSAAPFLADLLRPRRLVGVDVSAKSIEVARKLHSGTGATFEVSDGLEPAGSFDLVFCNGVFHHIPRAERAAALDYVFRSLRPGGLFSLWENNPWNPGTRFVMSRCPFDADAIPVSAPEARALARAAGFEVVRTDFLFIFPRALRWLRFVEPKVASLPLGAQYQVICRRP